jgi:hypothetical protein
LFKQAIDAINEDLPKFSSDFASTAQSIFLSYYSARETTSLATKRALRFQESPFVCWGSI